MHAIGYCRVSNRSAEKKAFRSKLRKRRSGAMAVVQGAEIVELIVDGGESAKNLDRPGMERLLALVDERKVDTVIIRDQVHIA
jgi:DNA invertase Pin-like site-specific DNA recombinase